MSTLTSDQSAFESAYGTAGETISFALLRGSRRRVEALQLEQLLHPTLPALPMIRSISGQTIDVYSHAFDTNDWQIGSTNSTLRSRRPVIRWNYDLSVEKQPGFTYLWIIAPAGEPFSLLTTTGFYGVIPDSTDEVAFFFSTDFGIYSISYDYVGGSGSLPGGDGDTWQGEEVTWQGESATW